MTQTGVYKALLMKPLTMNEREMYRVGNYGYAEKEAVERAVALYNESHTSSQMNMDKDGNVWCVSHSFEGLEFSLEFSFEMAFDVEGEKCIMEDKNNDQI